MSFPPEYFDKQDPRDDGLFYQFPRKVVHIDERAIQAVKSYYQKLLPPGGTYLDLMSSWRSHIPEALKPIHVTGLGMNAEEMADNPQLSEYVVHNLNQNPVLPFDHETFDAAMCAVSVQYLTDPLAVFQEVNRVLKPGGVFVATFSNRCFPSKAVAIWLNTTDQQHMALVSRYFEDAGNWENIQADYERPMFADPLFAVWGCKRA